MRFFALCLLLILVNISFSQTKEVKREIVYVYPDTQGDFDTNGQNESQTTTEQPVVTATSNSSFVPIPFFQGSLESALSQAKEQRKLIFVDFYADWCGPCKLIEQEVFVDPQFYSYINENFISIKIYEEDLNALGVEYTTAMKVFELPTLMVLNTKGEEMGRVTGYKTTHSYLLELKRIERYSAYKR